MLLHISRRLKSYIASILARHDNINRVELWDTLSNKAVLPTILHGCSTWLGVALLTSQKHLRSIQYKIPCSVLQIKPNPAFIATIGDLGWLPLSVEADRMLVKYFHYFQKIDYVD